MLSLASRSLTIPHSLNYSIGMASTKTERTLQTGQLLSRNAPLLPTTLSSMIFQSQTRLEHIGTIHSYVSNLTRYFRPWFAHWHWHWDKLHNLAMVFAAPWLSMTPMIPTWISMILMMVSCCCSPLRHPAYTRIQYRGDSYHPRRLVWNTIPSH